MRPSVQSAAVWLASAAAVFAPAASAAKVLESNSLSSCLDNSPLKASLFSVRYEPEVSKDAVVNLAVTTSFGGYVLFDISLIAYGYKAISTRLDPCTNKILSGLCPMIAGQLPGPFSIPVEGNGISSLPSIAFTMPDLDATVRIVVLEAESKGAIACIEADITNGKTVDLIGVKWATAMIALLTLVASAIISALGRPNTATHIAANSLSLVSYFQAQAIIGQTSVRLPPLVAAWTQNFQWSMGIINLGFMQTIFTWYQRATGGSPSTVFQTTQTLSVQVQKRSADLHEFGRMLVRRSHDLLQTVAPGVADRITNRLAKRSGNITDGLGSYLVFGIQRVAYRAGIESTNLFMTGLIFFCIFFVITVVAVILFKLVTNVLVKRGILRGDHFLEFRSSWRTVLKGVVYRVFLITFPQIAVLCLWEFTQGDSVAEVVLAVFFLLGFLIILVTGALKVFTLAKKSSNMHRNHAYSLYSDAHTLTKYGALYVQFRASAYYFIGPLLAYVLVKAMFVAFAQNSGITQAIAFIVLEAAALISGSVMRPWMDAPTNSFNIAIGVVNFLNAISLLVFSDVFDAPGLIAGVVGVVVFILNAAFSLVLLLMIIISTTISFFRKNSESRYTNMADDRASFIKSQTDLNTSKELDALAAAARGDD